MLTQRMASAFSTGQGVCVASSASGARRLGRPVAATQAATLSPRSLVAVGGLEDEARQMGREMHGVLAGAAGDLQHEPFRRQLLAQALENRPAIARGGGGVEAFVVRVSGVMRAVTSICVQARERPPRSSRVGPARRRLCHQAYTKEQ